MCDLNAFAGEQPKTNNVFSRSCLLLDMLDET